MTVVLEGMEGRSLGSSGYQSSDAQELNAYQNLELEGIGGVLDLTIFAISMFFSPLKIFAIVKVFEVLVLSSTFVRCYLIVEEVYDRRAYSHGPVWN